VYDELDLQASMGFGLSERWDGEMKCSYCFELEREDLGMMPTAN
jgi:hypothetical protein